MFLKFFIFYICDIYSYYSVVFNSLFSAVKLLYYFIYRREDVRAKDKDKVLLVLSSISLICLFNDTYLIEYFESIRSICVIYGMFAFKQFICEHGSETVI